jgi:hypothetical protein
MDINMSCQSEDQLDRLTLTGWALIVVHAAVFAVVGPLLVVNFLPAALIAGAGMSRRTMTAAIMISGGASFLLCKWLLQKCGITVIRPPLPKSQKSQDQV